MISAELADLRQGLTVLLASAPMTGLTAQIRVLLVRVHGTRAAPSEQAPQQATAASGALVGGFRGKIDVGDQHRIGVQNRSPIPVAGDRCDQRTLGGEDLLEELFGTPTVRIVLAALPQLARTSGCDQRREALPSITLGILLRQVGAAAGRERDRAFGESRDLVMRSEEHTSELQSRGHLVCRLLLD